mmetsp:Transcript_11557/g.48556  ORF Transcript_11557/g.48556 Transcript_11557/m.48556 type:complete len:588 (+) Transcript_11557:497-2260(+)
MCHGALLVHERALVFVRPLYLGNARGFLTDDLLDRPQHRETPRPARQHRTCSLWRKWLVALLGELLFQVCLVERVVRVVFPLPTRPPHVELLEVVIVPCDRGACERRREEGRERGLVVSRANVNGAGSAQDGLELARSHGYHAAATESRPQVRGSDGGLRESPLCICFARFPLVACAQRCSVGSRFLAKVDVKLRGHRPLDSADRVFHAAHLIGEKVRWLRGRAPQCRCPCGGRAAYCRLCTPTTAAPSLVARLALIPALLGRGSVQLRPRFLEDAERPAWRQPVANEADFDVDGLRACVRDDQPHTGDVGRASAREKFGAEEIHGEDRRQSHLDQHALILCAHQRLPNGQRSRLEDGRREVLRLRMDAQNLVRRHDVAASPRKAPVDAYHGLVHATLEDHVHKRRLRVLGLSDIEHLVVMDIRITNARLRPLPPRVRPKAHGGASPPFAIAIHAPDVPTPRAPVDRRRDDVSAIRGGPMEECAKCTILAQVAISTFGSPEIGAQQHVNGAHAPRDVARRCRQQSQHSQQDDVPRPAKNCLLHRAPSPEHDIPTHWGIVCRCVSLHRWRQPPPAEPPALPMPVIKPV